MRQDVDRTNLFVLGILAILGAVLAAVGWMRFVA
jgi:hypothetical protein